MLVWEEKEKNRAEAAIPTLVTSFKPRQVLLKSKANMKHDNDNSTKTPISLTPEPRVLLLQSICQFLEHSGFSKTLKKFRKEADIEKESWKSCLLNLEEMCCEYLKTNNDTKAAENAIQKQGTNQKDGGFNDLACAETVEGTKENKGDKRKKYEAIIENHTLESVDVKPKKKKKSKSANDSTEQVAEENHSKPSENPGEITLNVLSEPAKKFKDKKKKHKDESQPLNEDLLGKLAEVAAQETSEKGDAVSQKEKSKSKKKKEDTENPNNSSMETTEVDKEKKSSKKRIKSSSEENGTDDVEEAELEDSKRRKTDNPDHFNGHIQPPKTPNGVSEKDGEKSQKKDKLNQHNGSAEPKTANAFRRVKPDEVEFADEKLQDNSYWAKDGADSGYGAKAQEVLGQVRGRDFRHEKTKKKRGSYRGGHIDLQSHSVKFNYDNDDE